MALLPVRKTGATLIQLAHRASSQCVVRRPTSGGQVGSQRQEPTPFGIIAASMGAVEFQTLRREDGMLELLVTVRGNGHLGTHKAYVYPEELNAFGAALQSYPFSETREAVLEAGSLDPDWYGYLRLRVFLLAGFGRSALEMQYDTRGELPERASGTFYVPGDPASFSRLGEEICRFASMEGGTMRNEWHEV